MPLSPEQETRVAMVNELITDDPQAAHALASQWDRMIRDEEAARAEANAERFPQLSMDELEPEQEKEGGY